MDFNFLSHNYIFGSTNYFFWIGTLYLVILTYQDFKNNMLVDDRYNFLMMGFSFSLCSHVNRPFWYMIILILIVLLLSKYLIKFKIVGAGDAKALAWIIYGFGIVNTFGLLWFFILFSILTVIHGLAKRFVFKVKGPVPFFGIILFSFFLSSLLFGFY